MQASRFAPVKSFIPFYPCSHFVCMSANGEEYIIRQQKSLCCLENGLCWVLCFDLLYSLVYLWYFYYVFVVVAATFCRSNVLLRSECNANFVVLHTDHVDDTILHRPIHSLPSLPILGCMWNRRKIQQHQQLPSTF